MALLLPWRCSICISPALSPVLQAGSAHVRIRRDANEQLVLAHASNRLLPLVSTLTVQIFKDDWTRPVLAGTVSPPVSTPHHATESSASLPPLVDPLTSTPSKHGNPPPEFAFETPGRNVAPMVLPTAGLHLHRPYGSLGLAYGAPTYTGGLGPAPAQPGFGLRPGLHAVGGAYRGLGVASAGTFRTSFGGSVVPLRFSTGNPASTPPPHRPYRP